MVKKISNYHRILIALYATLLVFVLTLFFVFIPKGKYFEPKEIIAKRINSNQFEVIGLSENDEVIDKAAFLLDSDAITNGLYNSSDDDDDW